MLTIAAHLNTVGRSLYDKQQVTSHIFSFGSTKFKWFTDNQIEITL